MQIARVVGSAVSTIKDDALTGRKLLVVRPADPSDQLVGDPYVAVDAIGAGEGELVLVVTGSAARRTASTADAPVDAAIIAILDSLEVGGEATFRKGY
ncbi:EutN/CcmL family microcompartment protein [Tessaracoccus caeni]|uniref:EutN/CcmL family microcompartment protein n=1 Tax=Tessaracoccus caeni TaxID=3031239 RepID=UPI0023DA7A30|nr:EutN/CcmL family microcompartment protein [Tessaracoccus caeni]MDF1490073.1 EutN/CcmL family microcompartment protein [Tessaracoccus caeni]